MPENSNSNSNTNTPLGRELNDEDADANDNQSGNPQRDQFKKIHGHKEPPPNVPTADPLGDDTPAPHDSDGQ